MRSVVERVAEPRSAVPADSPDPALASELDQASRRLEAASPVEVLTWAFERFGRDAVLTSSFQDCVLIDLAVQVDPGVRVVFLDTGYHFPETLAYMRHVQERYGLDLEVVVPAIPLDDRPCGSPGCCEARKVTPLDTVLAGARAWLTGVKRVDTPERANAPVVAWDAKKHVVKVNPIVAWTEDDVEAFVVQRDLPRHPLNAVGYFSIGCAPTTRPVTAGQDPRAGRWPGSVKTECGLHL